MIINSPIESNRATREGTNPERMTNTCFYHRNVAKINTYELGYHQVVPFAVSSWSVRRAFFHGEFFHFYFSVYA